MLTLFAIPKPFRGHIGIIQRNAIQSWKQTCPGCEIILFGNDEGTAEAAREFDVRHVPEILTNEHGTPLVSDLFERAERMAECDVLAYVNADIILMSDFLSAVDDVARFTDRFLLVGQRWDVGIRELWDFASPDWESRLRTLVQESGSLGPKSAIDYFVFSRGLWGAIPPFAIGRMGWDNWLVYRARQRAMVVDATERIMALHQSHDYTGFSSKNSLRLGPEALENRSLLGQDYSDLHDVTHLLLPDGLSSAWTLGRLLRNPRRAAARYPVLRGLMRPKRTLIRIWRSARSVLGLDRNPRNLSKS